MTDVGKRNDKDVLAGKILHINYQPGVSCPYPILNRLRTSKSKGIQERFAQWPENMVDVSLALATKLVILRTVIGSFNRELVSLNKDLASHPDQVKKCMLEEFVYRLEDEDLVYRILAGLDAFLYEWRSAYELMGHYLKGLFASVLQKPLNETTIKRALRERDCDIRWTDVLRDERITYFHQTAPWIALRRLPAKSTTAFEMLIVRRHTGYHLDPGDYIELGEYQAIYAGFNQSLGALQAFVLDAIAEAEDEELKGNAVNRP